MDDIANDINGDFYVAGQQGEIEEDLAYRHVVIPRKHVDVFRLGIKPNKNDVNVQEACRDTIKANYWYVLAHPKANNPRHSFLKAARIAYLRVLGLLLGVGDSQDQPAAHNCRYNDVKIIDTNATVAIDTDNVPITDDVPNWAADAVWRIGVRRKVTDILGNIGFNMRTRGHHGLDDMVDRYERVWHKCLYDEDNPGLEWLELAHDVYHFLYPDVLDGFWVDACTNERCAGALIKRVNSFAAGTAAVGAVATGLEDLTIVFPKMRDLLDPAYAEIERCMTVIGGTGGRWAGSINRRYYGAGELVPNERVMASAAAVTLAALAAMQSDAPLRNSDALKRVGRNAPITGHIIQQIITKATQHDRMVLAILPADEDVD